MADAYKKVEFLANVAIILVALLLGTILVKRYLLPTSQPKQVAARSEVKVGTKLSLPGVDWATNGQTLILALSQGCRYCSESAPFYQRINLERAGKNIRVIAVLPQVVSEGQKYLGDLGVYVDQVIQVPLEIIEVKGTPTLILTNKDGVVTDTWFGKLPTDKESEVVSKLLQCGSNQQCG